MANSLAYCLGMNSLYLNLAGREQEGIIPPDRRAALEDELETRLKSWTGPDGRAVVGQLIRNKDAFPGPLGQFGPDLLVGYNPGYRSSQETGLGGWRDASLEANQDHWRGDHCFAAASVPGVIFASHQPLGDRPITYEDIPGLAIDVEPDRTPPQGLPPGYGTEPGPIEERLRSLGYL